jgi:hypothetical protein
MEHAGMTLAFKVEDAVSVDASGYDLVSPGTISKLPGVVLAITEGPQPCYYVRVRLQLGGVLDMVVPPEKMERPVRAPRPCSTDRAASHAH